MPKTFPTNPIPSMPDTYEEHLALMLEEFAPTSYSQQVHTERMAMQAWLLRRLLVEMATALDEDAAMHSRKEARETLAELLRYEAALQRWLANDLAHLKRLKSPSSSRRPSGVEAFEAILPTLPSVGADQGEALKAKPKAPPSEIVTPSFSFKNGKVRYRF